MTIEKLESVSMPQNDGMIRTGEDCKVTFQRPVAAGEFGTATVKDNPAQVGRLGRVLPGKGRIGGEGYKDMARIEPKHPGSGSVLVEAGDHMAVGKEALGKAEWFERN